MSGSGWKWARNWIIINLLLLWLLRPFELHLYRNGRIDYITLLEEATGLKNAHSYAYLTEDEGKERWLTGTDCAGLLQWVAGKLQRVASNQKAGLRRKWEHRVLSARTPGWDLPAHGDGLGSQPITFCTMVALCVRSSLVAFIFLYLTAQLTAAPDTWTDRAYCEITFQSAPPTFWVLFFSAVNI